MLPTIEPTPMMMHHAIGQGRSSWKTVRTTSDYPIYPRHITPIPSAYTQEKRQYSTMPEMEQCNDTSVLAAAPLLLASIFRFYM